RIKYGRVVASLRTTNTWEALDALWSARLLTREEQLMLQTCYDFLRLVEGRLRIVHNRSLDELPQRPEELEKLARRLGCEAGPGESVGQRFLAQLDLYTTKTRELFLHLVQREKGAP